MRKKSTSNGLTASAIAGTHVVLLGWDITDWNGFGRDLLGFAIRRVDQTENETFWLRGMKTFPGTNPPLPLGGTASSQDQPFQSFQWGDYTAKPGHEYTYTIQAMGGEPGALTVKASIDLLVQTEAEEGEVHSVYFNRGAVASQEYARRFQNKAPSEVGDAAYAWLSRGLLEAIIGFIAKATDASFSLRIAIYEFQWPAILNALKAAETRGVNVKVLYDAIENANEDPVKPNEEQIEAAGISDFCQGLTMGKIMHNKFIVLLKNAVPTAVLTGSTNYTDNGLFGHLNCAHVVTDNEVAGMYLDFWNELAKDQELSAVREWNDAKTPAPTNPPARGIKEVFSPQTGTSTLSRYGEIAGTAQKALFMTFAFGMNKVFLPIYQKPDSVLRFALMDKEGTGKGLAQAKVDIAALRKLKNAVIAVGQNIVLNEFDRWLKEISGIKAKENVRWVHTKFMLVDPLSDDPIVITGSANFSDASVSTNHENMLVIRGDKRVADIYLGEFMRQFSSYAFRDAAADAAKSGDSGFKPQDLATDASWMKRYSGTSSSGALRRLYFSS